jgi:hypothetical protein
LADQLYLEEFQGQVQGDIVVLLVEYSLAILLRLLWRQQVAVAVDKYREVLDCLEDQGVEAPLASQYWEGLQYRQIRHLVFMVIMAGGVLSTFLALIDASTRVVVVVVVVALVKMW